MPSIALCCSTVGVPLGDWRAKWADKVHWMCCWDRARRDRGTLVRELQRMANGFWPVPNHCCHFSVEKCFFRRLATDVAVLFFKTESAKASSFDVQWSGDDSRRRSTTAGARIREMEPSSRHAGLAG
jgi:hypothetical protein